jgi:GT2 family glycosyltransferase
MKADVVVVAYRSEDEIADCLAAVLDDSLVASVTVVDNGDGRSAAVAEELEAFAVHAPDNPGFGAAVNRGAARGTAEAILVLNPDARLTPIALADGLVRLERHPMVAAVQGSIVNRTTGYEERSAGRELGLVHLVGRALGLKALLRFRAVRALARRSPGLADHVERRPDADRRVESLAATAIVLRRSAFTEVGGFDERYFLYGEDLDLCRRLRRAGWALLAVPDTWAEHTSGGSAATSWARELTWWEGTLRFARTHWTGRQRAALAPIVLVVATRLVAARPSRWREVLGACRGTRRTARASVVHDQTDGL